jgi:Tfp pilus assembly protein PilF
LLTSPDQPPIVRATALGYLGSYQNPVGVQLAATSLGDPDPLVRLAAAEAMGSLPLSMKQPLLTPLLADSVRSVRTEAARQLAGVAPASLSPEDRQTLTRVLAEYVAIQKDNADRPEARLNLALVYAAAGQSGTAEQQLLAAIRLHPGFEPAYVNLADVYRARGEEARAETVLKSGLEAQSESAAIHHAMGLLIVRTQGGAAALPWLEQAAELAPGNTRFRYVWAVALRDAGRQAEAMSVLEKAHANRPADGDVLYALAIYSRDAGDRENAAAYAAELQALQPHNAQAAALVAELEGS